MIILDMNKKNVNNFIIKAEDKKNITNKKKILKYGRNAYMR